MKPLIAAESVVRNNSVTKAAEEINLTCSAVSQQLRVLEGAMKISFFSREKGEISVKPEYRSYFELVGKSFNMLKYACETLTGSETYSTLTISVLHSFLSLCMMNALADFQSNNPNIKLNILSSLDIANLHTDDIGLSIRYTATIDDPSLVFHKIRDDYIIPCATNDLIEKLGGIEIERFIENSKLIDDAAMSLVKVKPGWDHWYDKKQLDPNRIISFADYSHVLNAGLQGMGAFMARTGLMIDPQIDKRLTPLVPDYCKSGASLYVVHSSHIPMKPEARILKNWILNQFSDRPNDSSLL
ncbi:MAG: LysR family transcriptional regulator [Arenicella sp.]|nr:LysR family transcriptional regulator [Arenicella sp.]